MENIVDAFARCKAGVVHNPSRDQLDDNRLAELVERMGFADNLADIAEIQHEEDNMVDPVGKQIDQQNIVVRDKAVVMGLDEVATLGFHPVVGAAVQSDYHSFVEHRQKA